MQFEVESARIADSLCVWMVVINVEISLWAYKTREAELFMRRTYLSLIISAREEETFFVVKKYGMIMAMTHA